MTEKDVKDFLNRGYHVKEQIAAKQPCKLLKKAMCMRFSFSMALIMHRMLNMDIGKNRGGIYPL